MVWLGKIWSQRNTGLPWSMYGGWNVRNELSTSRFCTLRVFEYPIVTENSPCIVLRYVWSNMACKSPNLLLAGIKGGFPRAPAILSGWTMLNLHLSPSHPMKSLWNPMKSPWKPCHRHGDMSRSCRFSGTALRQCCSTSLKKQSRPVGAGISSRISRWL